MAIEEHGNISFKGFLYRVNYLLDHFNFPLSVLYYAQAWLYVNSYSITIAEHKIRELSLENVSTVFFPS